MTEFLFLAVALPIGLVGFSLMLTSFTLIALRGGWHSAMATGPRGGWSLARILMLAGASLGVVFSGLIIVFTRWLA